MYFNAVSHKFTEYFKLVFEAKNIYISLEKKTSTKNISDGRPKYFSRCIRYILIVSSRNRDIAIHFSL